ncbi:hypothetical protein JTB14_024174 [Gonioctena quinquepunctata]|nr:hypothetical protein JTB14_024174 [Gonioctena quinquepunctata]
MKTKTRINRRHLLDTLRIRLQKIRIRCRTSSNNVESFFGDRNNFIDFNGVVKTARFERYIDELEDEINFLGYSGEGIPTREINRPPNRKSVRMNKLNIP